ncbi:MAG: lipoprotein insertase outer membrane protein LolB [Wenzhouxiangellaceae bacterium]|nr:lipoprotein insertase outer membrane protein LolB [Wenzhouxiangellaceae bacterium]
MSLDARPAVGRVQRSRVFERSLTVIALAVLLSSCAVREPRPGGAWLAEREAWFAAHPDWSVRGRLALSDGERGGSLSLAWQARGDWHRVELSSGLGGKRWQLEMNVDGARLTGSEIGTLTGSDPDQLIERAIGWPVPVAGLVDWLRGLPGPALGQARYADDGTLAALTWGGWAIEYPRWNAVAGGVLLPTRVSARRGTQSVKAVLSGWRFETGSGAAGTPGSTPASEPL